MNSMRLYYALLSAALLAGVMAFLSACRHEIPQPVTPGGNGGGTDTVIVNPHPCNPDTVYFENTILPLLVSNCAQSDCHDAITHEDGIRLYSYSTIMASGVIDPGDPVNSDLYQAITEDDPADIMPPAPNAPLTQDQISQIYTWIAQGARNNSCTPECDPAQFSFSQNIYPVIELACQGCHSGSNPDGGLLLTDYSHISASALDGSLLNSLLGQNGFTLMPYNTAGLPQCNIDQIEAWINAGAPND